MKYLALTLASLLLTQSAQANICDDYRSSHPKLYELFCGGGGRGGAKTSGANPSFSSAFNISPANAPTRPTPYGLESILSFTRHPPTDYLTSFSIIKGFRRIGTGLSSSTGSNNTFFANDVIQRATSTPEYTTFDPPEAPKSSIPNLNLGTAFELYSGKGTLNSLKLGLSVRHTKATDTLGYGIGVETGWNLFTLGLGLANEMIATYLPRVSFYSLVAGFRLFVFDLEYTLLKNSGGYGLSPIHIGTASLTYKRITLTGAVRRLEFIHYGAVTQHHLALQVRLSKHFVAGYMYNYIPGANSVAIQAFL